MEGGGGATSSSSDSSLPSVDLCTTRTFAFFSASRPTWNHYDRRKAGSAGAPGSYWLPVLARPDTTIGDIPCASELVIETLRAGKIAHYLTLCVACIHTVHCRSHSTTNSWHYRNSSSRFLHQYLGRAHLCDPRLANILQTSCHIVYGVADFRSLIHCYLQRDWGWVQLLHHLPSSLIDPPIKLLQPHVFMGSIRSDHIS